MPRNRKRNNKESSSKMAKTLDDEVIIFSNEHQYRIQLRLLLEKSPILEGLFYPPIESINFSKYNNYVVKKVVEFCKYDRIQHIENIKDELLKFAEQTKMDKLKEYIINSSLPKVQAINYQIEPQGLCEELPVINYKGEPQHATSSSSMGQAAPDAFTRAVILRARPCAGHQDENQALIISNAQDECVPMAISIVEDISSSPPTPEASPIKPPASIQPEYDPLLNNKPASDDVAVVQPRGITVYSLKRPIDDELAEEERDPLLGIRIQSAEHPQDPLPPRTPPPLQQQQLIITSRLISSLPPSPQRKVTTTASPTPQRSVKTSPARQQNIADSPATPRLSRTPSSAEEAEEGIIEIPPPSTVPQPKRSLLKSCRQKIRSWFS